LVPCKSLNTSKIYSLPPLATWVTYQFRFNHLPTVLTVAFCSLYPSRRKLPSGGAEQIGTTRVKKKCQSPLTRRQMAATFTASIITAIRQQPNEFCTITNQRQADLLRGRICFASSHMSSNRSAVSSVGNDWSNGSLILSLNTAKRSARTARKSAVDSAWRTRPMALD
jgi:hypothetical protein